MSQNQDPPVLKQISNFTHSASGLERTLRLIQALAQIVSDVSDDATAARWGAVKGQLALTRRYFRFFNFIECFERVSALFNNRNNNGNLNAITTIELAQWTCLGAYYLLEDLTILDAMNMHASSWTDAILIESNKFWFYALSLSVLGGILGLFFMDTDTPSSEKKTDDDNDKSTSTEKKKNTASDRQTTVLMKRIVVDACDLLIPASFLGWIPISQAAVGMAMVLSTVVTTGDVWEGTRWGVR